MKKEKLGALLLALVFCIAAFCPLTVLRAASGVSFTEIMYDPQGSDTNREWIEVYNGGAAAVDLSTYILQTDGTASSHHVLVPQGSGIVPAGSYAVIVQNIDAFKTDYPNYAGILLDSSWTGLTSNAGKTLVLTDSQGNIQDQVTYDPTIGGTNDGNSLQKNSSGAWIAALPTPGSAAGAASVSTIAPAIVPPASPVVVVGNGSLEAAETPAPLETQYQPKKSSQMEAELSVPDTAVAGVEISAVASVTGYEGEAIENGGFHYAFGDGTACDLRSPAACRHTYLSPGAYIVSFEYRSNPYASAPDAVAEASIDVTGPSVSIASVEKDGTIVFSNSGKDDADISGWSVWASTPSLGAAPFYFPMGTMIQAGMSITLSSRITGFSGLYTSFILRLPSGETAASYTADLAGQAQQAHAPNAAVPSVQPISTEEAPAMLPVLSAVKSSPMASEKETKPDLPPVPLAANVEAALPQEKTPAVSSEGPAVFPIIIGIAGILLAGFVALRHFGFFPKKAGGGAADGKQAKSQTEALADDITIIE